MNSAKVSHTVRMAVLTLHSSRIEMPRRRCHQHLLSSANFYAAADIKKVAGPTDAWCAVLFGYTGVEAWHAFKIREHEWMLTQDVGAPDHNKLAGPNQNNAISEVTHVAIFVRDGETKLYLNNVEVGPVPGIRPPPGRVWLALQVPAQRSAVECAFHNFIVRAPN
jgi:hypothetical protein